LSLITETYLPGARCLQWFKATIQVDKNEA
jgi:hypothetical protein